MLPSYATREDVKRALDYAETARNNDRIDRALQSASRNIDSMSRRTFYPRRTFIRLDWPQDRYAPTFRLWLNQYDLLELDELKIGASVVDPAEIKLYPSDGTLPYRRIELDEDGSYSFERGQQEIWVSGLFGYSNDETQIGALAGPLGGLPTDTAEITLTTPRVGVGDLLRIDDEYVIVAERTMVDSGQTLGADLTDLAGGVTVPVADGTGFGAGQVILVDGERMLVVDVAANTLVVKRAWDGSVLATHTTGAAVFSLTGLDLERGQLGTDPAAHDAAAPVLRWVPPALVHQLAIAEAEDTLLQESAGYARTSGSGDNAREARAVALKDLRARVCQAHGRNLLIGAV